MPGNYRVATQVVASRAVLTELVIFSRYWKQNLLRIGVFIIDIYMKILPSCRPKRRSMLNGLQGVISLKIESLITTGVRTSDPVKIYVITLSQFPLIYRDITCQDSIYNDKLIPGL
jgi:hypothetical protein